MLKTLGIVKGALLTNKQRRHLARCLEGKSVLEWVVRQMTDCELLSGVVVLADAGKEGDVVRSLTPNDVPVFSADASDTLGMLLQVFERFPVDSCVFIGADWPFIDPTLIDQLVRTADREKNCDYAAYQFTNDVFSVGRPYGLFPEWYRSATLRKAAKKLEDQVHRQLPGSFFLDNQDKYAVELLPAPAGLDRDDLHMSFDDEDDWDNIVALHDAMGLDVLDSRKVSTLLSSGIYRGELAVH
jgi:spore coat polysaccharide biosynthesis protein SpsF (cytidylyltransferase family)